MIVCQECQGEYKFLPRHLKGAHGLSQGEYRARWDIPAGVLLGSDEYKAHVLEGNELRGGTYMPRGASLNYGRDEAGRRAYARDYQRAMKAHKRAAAAAAPIEVAAPQSAVPSVRVSEVPPERAHGPGAWDAVSQFIAHREDIVGMLGRMTECAEGFFGRNADNLDWGDVGTIGSMAEVLRLVHDRMCPAGTAPQKNG